MDTNYEFQIQWDSGNWDTILYSVNCSDMEIKMNMTSIQNRFNGRRTRCIRRHWSSDGQMVDMI